MAIRGSGYIQKAFYNYDIKRIIQSFKESHHHFGEFDGIICRGTSGLLIAPTLAYTFDKKLVVVRKHRSDSHAEALLEGHDDINKYIIVDDFICTGNTLEQIYDAVHMAANGGNNNQTNPHWHAGKIPEFIGCFFWNPLSYIDRTTDKIKMRNHIYWKLDMGNKTVIRCCDPIPASNNKGWFIDTGKQKKES
jgi:hypothetical protein